MFYLMNRNIIRQGRALCYTLQTSCPWLPPVPRGDDTWCTGRGRTCSLAQSKNSWLAYDWRRSLIISQAWSIVRKWMYHMIMMSNIPDICCMIGDRSFEFCIFNTCISILMKLLHTWVANHFITCQISMYTYLVTRYQRNC